MPFNKAYKLSIFFILVSVFSSTCKEREEPLAIDLKIYNLQTSGSTTISQFGVLNGYEIASSTYPYILNSNGGEFIKRIEGEDDVLLKCYVFIFIQNYGVFQFEITNSSKINRTSIDKNHLDNDGCLSIVLNKLHFTINAVSVEEKYHVLIEIMDTSNIYSE